MTNPYWPFFDLRITTPRLELRLASDDDLIELASISDAVHPEGKSPFSVAWAERVSPERERSIIQNHWKHRANLKPEDWALPFVVSHKGALVGNQTLKAEDFAVLRSVNTGSWLNQRWQGLGLSKEMRAAVLSFAFDTLEAEEAVTDALDWNASSNAVSKALGYEPNGLRSTIQRGERATLQEYRMTREQWETGAKHYTQVQVSGHEACLPLLGVT